MTLYVADSVVPLQGNHHSPNKRERYALMSTPYSSLTIAQLFQEKSINPQQDIIFYSPFLSNGVNIAVNGVLLPVDHGYLLDHLDTGGFPLALPAENYDWVPFVSSEDELQSLLWTLAQVDSGSDEEMAGIIFPKALDAPIRVFRPRRSGKGYVAYPINATPNTATIEQVIATLSTPNGRALAFDFDDSTNGLLKSVHPELINTSWNSDYKWEGTTDHTGRPGFRLGATVARDLISYLYGVQVSMPHGLPPEDLTSLEDTIAKTYETNRIVPTSGIYFSIEPDSSSDDFTTFVNGIPTPNTLSVTDDDLRWYPFTTNVGDLKILYTALVDTFIGYHSTLNFKSLGVYFPNTLDQLTDVIFLTDEGYKGFSLKSIGTIASCSLRKVADALLQAFAQGNPAHTGFKPFTYNAGRAFTNLELPPVDSSSDSALSALNHYSLLLSKGFCREEPLFSTVLQSPWVSHSLTLSVTPEGIAINDTWFEVSPGSPEPFRSSPLLGEVLGSLPNYLAVVSSLYGLLPTIRTNRVSLVIPDTAGSPVVLVVNPTSRHRRDFTLGNKDRILPTDLPRVLRDTQAYFDGLGLDILECYDIERRSYPYLEIPSPLIQGISSDTILFLKTLCTEVEDHTDPGLILTPEIRDYLSDNLPSNKRIVIVRSPSRTPDYSEVAAYLIQTTNASTLGGVKDSLMSYITEAGHSDLEDVPTYVWAAALKSVDLSQTTLVINHDALSKVLSYNSEYYHFLQDIQARQVYILARFAVNNQQLERASDYKILGYSEHLLDVPVSNLETAPTSTRSPLELRLLKHLNNSHAERILPDSRVSNKCTQIVSEDTVQFITGLTKDLQDQISSFFQKVSYDSDSVMTISDLAEAILSILRNYNPSSEPPKGTLPATLPFSPDLLRTLGGRKAHLRCSQTVFQDLQALCDLVESEYGRDPIVLSGHRLSTLLPINLTILFLSDSLAEGDVQYLEPVLDNTDLIISEFRRSSVPIPNFPEVFVGLEEPSNNPPLRVKPLDLPPSANPSDDDTLLPAHSKVSITAPDGRVLDHQVDTEGTTSSELIRKVRDFFATETS